MTTKTLRRRFFSMAGRLTRSARRLTLHLPRGWPWEEQFSRALARLRALPLPSCGAIRNRPNASKLASARAASVSCCVHVTIPRFPAPPLSKPGAATDPLPCHIRPHGAQAFSLVGSLIPTCLAFTPPIGGFGLSFRMTVSPDTFGTMRRPIVR